MGKKTKRLPRDRTSTAATLSASTCSPSPEASNDIVMLEGDSQHSPIGQSDLSHKIDMSIENLNSELAESVAASATTDVRYYRQYPHFHDVDEMNARLPAPMNRCSLTWSNVSYALQAPRKICRNVPRRGKSEQYILRDVSGRSAPGELTAILGSSGAGKTTLLDILADRVRSSKYTRVDGSIELNGQPRQAKTFRSMVSYVPQDMAFMGSFTVLETLQMAAGLSLPSYVPQMTREMRVQDVIDDMGLRSCARTKVGDVFCKGISTGQRKRLGIAVELLSNPSILLLDEPTSGLDASSACNVMHHLVQLVKSGKNIVCTLHQPSSKIYMMLSNIAIMSAGRLVYFGPTSSALQHFEQLRYPCPMYSNPAEHFLQLVNKDFHDDLDIVPFVAAWVDSHEAHSLSQSIAADKQQYCGIEQDVVHTLSPSAVHQFTVFLHRNWANNWRNPGVFWIRVFMYVMLTFMVGTMYLSTNNHITSNAMVSLLFYVQAFLVFMSVAVLPAIIEQRAVLDREMLNNSINVFSYTIANLVGGLPGLIVISLLATTIVVYLAGVYSFGSFFFNLLLSLIVAESLMHVIGAAVPHYIIGIAVGAGVFGMFMLCEGFMVPYSYIPSYWIWGYYLAFHTYSFQSFMFEHFSTINTPESWQVLKEYDMENVNVGKNMLVLIVYALVLQLVFGFILQYSSHRRK